MDGLMEGWMDGRGMYGWMMDGWKEGRGMDDGWIIEGGRDGWMEKGREGGRMEGRGLQLCFLLSASDFT